MGTSKNNILSLENCHLLIIERQQYEDIMRKYLIENNKNILIFYR